MYFFIYLRVISMLDKFPVVSARFSIFWNRANAIQTDRKFDQNPQSQERQQKALHDFAPILFYFFLSTCSQKRELAGE